MKIFISTSHSLDAARHLWHSHAERGNEYKNYVCKMVIVTVTASRYGLRYQTVPNEQFSLFLEIQSPL
ncbi:MAG: hypothetical protein Q7J76_02700 [Candidatus Brocadiaceae bacterium]|nr:hypothetical protein [Candidatus Brocadiaceae bacterium]